MNGKRRRVPLCANKAASKQLLAKLIVDAKLAAHGVADRYAERQGDGMSRCQHMHIPQMQADVPSIRELSGQQVPFTRANVCKELRKKATRADASGPCGSIPNQVRT